MKPQGPISNGLQSNGGGDSDGHLDAGGQTAQEETKSPSVFKRTAAEFLGAVGFVSMFAAIGNALIPAIVGGAAAFTATTFLTIGVGLAIGLSAMAGSAVLKKSMETDALNAKKTEGHRHEKPAQVIVNNLQVQPNVDIETETKLFTKMIEAERAQLQQDPHRHK